MARSVDVMAAETRRVIEIVWRIESARVFAGLTRIVREEESRLAHYRLRYWGEADE